MELTFFGTSHGAPEVGRFCSGTLLETGGLSYLIDCGAPVDALMLNAGKKFEVLRAIFITHMHEDHMGTLPAMVKCRRRAMMSESRRANLSITPEEVV